jgi:hypothetical protein
MTRQLFQGRVTVAFAFEAVVLALTGSTIAYLLRRSVRDWFRLAERLRAEHGHGHGTPMGRDNKRT